MVLAHEGYKELTVVCNICRPKPLSKIPFQSISPKTVWYGLCWALIVAISDIIDEKDSESLPIAFVTLRWLVKHYILRGSSNSITYRCVRMSFCHAQHSEPLWTLNLYNQALNNYEISLWALLIKIKLSVNTALCILSSGAGVTW